MRVVFLSFWDPADLEFLLTFMTYCAHLTFCIDDIESVLEAENEACLPYIVCWQREAGSANQVAHII